MRINLLVLYQTLHAYALHFSRRPQYNLFYINISVFIGFKEDKQGTLLYDITYRKKLFIGINVRKIRDCQKSRKVKHANIWFLRYYLPGNNTGEVCYCEKSAICLGFKPVSSRLQDKPQVRHSITELQSLPSPEPKNSSVIRETFSP